MLRAVFACSLLALSCAISTFSQAVNATLLGTITDAGGGVFPGAKVTITETNTGVSKTGVTNESGNYTFSDLPPGTYTVTAEQTGFKTYRRDGIELRIGERAFAIKRRTMASQSLIFVRRQS